MKSWILASFAAAFLFGSYNIFAKMAAGRLTDSMAAFVLEFSAAVLILLYIIFGGSIKADFTTATSRGVLYAIIGGLFIGSGSIFYFFAFRQHAPLAVAGPIIFAGATLIMIIAGLIFFKEKLNLMTLAGLALTLGGIILLSISANRG